MRALGDGGEGFSRGAGVGANGHSPLLSPVTPSPHPPISPSPHLPIIEATGWSIGADGAITLTATAPKTSSDWAITPPKTCNIP
ncbi:hypothetical protein [[Phormidium] sp. ETS-05]|uniref:hypothetical protein n=1 Tax=[Phormidium] sp. ETS-05 TaxID=222819 RepID=UPI0018EF1D06|nr:hypothetical protein [[Phormidium] sp. ETS-05]